MNPSVKEILDILDFKNWNKEDLIAELEFRTKIIMCRIEAEFDKLFISKEKYDDLHKDFLKMSNLCGKAQNKLRQARKELKERMDKVLFPQECKKIIDEVLG